MNASRCSISINCTKAPVVCVAAHWKGLSTQSVGPFAVERTDCLSLWRACVCFACSAYHGHVSSLIDISPYKFQHLSDDERNQTVHVVSGFFLFKSSFFALPAYYENSMTQLTLTGFQEASRKHVGYITPPPIPGPPIN